MRGFFPPLLVLALSCAALGARADSLSVRCYTLADGLSGMRPIRVVALPTEEGGATRLLVQEEDGVCLFDGARFQPLPFDRHKTLPVQSFFSADCFLDARQGRLWLRDYYALTVYDLQTLHQLDARELLHASGEQPRNVSIDDEGNVWVHANNDTLYFQSFGGVEREPVVAFTERNAEGLSPMVCGVVEVGGLHLVLVSTGEVVCLERTVEGFSEHWRQSVCAPLTAYTVRGMAWDERTLLLTTSKEFIRFDTHTRQQTPLPFVARINDMHRAADGSLMAATDEGVVHYDRQFHVIGHCDAFTSAGQSHSPRIMSMAFDHEGGLWACTAGDGVYYHNPAPPLARFVPIGGSLAADVRSLCPCADGALLAATSAGVYRLSSDGGAERIATLPDVPFIDIAPDGQGHLWATTSQGQIHELDSTGHLLRTFSNEAVHNLSGAVPFCLPLGEGRFLTCVRLNRLALFHPDSCRLDVQTERFPELLRYRNVVDACPMLGGYLVGTQNGLYHFEAMGEGTWFDPLPGLNDALRSTKCTSLLRDRAGVIWIGTSGGLYRYDEQSSGLAMVDMPGNACVQSLAEDGEGNVWVSMATGIVWLGNGETFTLNASDGVGEAAFMEHSACCMTDGTMVFGAQGGVYMVEASAVAPFEAPALQARVMAVMVNDSSLSPGHSLRLRHDENTLSFSLSALAYARPQHVVYRYRLRPRTANEGDSPWEQQRDERGNIRVAYRMLSPGSYLFEAQARVQGGSWGPTTSFVVRILPPWWRSWWAWLGYALLFVAALAYVALHFVRQHNRRLDYARRLRTQRDREQLGEERMRFYTNITHELRTPLTLILGPLEDLCENPNLPAALQERVRRISDSAHRLLQLVNRLLEFRKVETGHRQLNLRPLNLATHCGEQFRHFAHMNRNSRLQFREEIDPAGMDILLDPDAITTILSNLLSNAVKFTPSGIITLSLHREGDLVVLKVADTGIGIPADVLPRLFEPYYQVEGSGQRGGTGIGLALVRSLVALHQGRLDVQSQQGKGTTFTVTLAAPQQQPSPAPLIGAEPSARCIAPDCTDFASTASEAPLQSGGAAEAELALVVEDNADIRQYIVDSLSPQWRCLVASDGREGVEMAITEIPDIVITDVMMPEMDGIQLCRHLRSDVRTSHIPLVMLTAKDSIGDKEAGYEAGADAYLTKPFTARMLRALLTNIRASRQQLALQRPAAPPNGGELHTQEPCGQGVAALSTLDRRFIHDLDELIASHLDDPSLDMPFLCDHLFMSRTTLYRKVKALLGHSPNEYVRKRRLQRAHEMLSSPQYAHRTVTSIAYDCGFASLGYFRSCFKAEFGISPTQMVR